MVPADREDAEPLTKKDLTGLEAGATLEHRGRAKSMARTAKDETAQSVTVFNATLAPIVCTTVDGQSVIRFEAKSRRAMSEADLSEEMRTHIARGRLLLEAASSRVTE